MEYLVPAIGAIGIILTAYAAVRKASEDSAAGAAERWKTLVATLQERIEKVEEDRDHIEAEAEAQQKRIRELETRERLANERLLHLESDHGDLVREHKRLKAQLEKLAKRVEYYKKGVALLVTQILEHGLEPAWRPIHEDDVE